MASSLRQKLPARLRELRIHACQSSSESAPTRQFVASIFPEVKKHNPTLPILIREAAGVPPRAIARGPSGYERQTDLTGATSAEQVEQRIASLLQDARFRDGPSTEAGSTRPGSGTQAA